MKTWSSSRAKAISPHNPTVLPEEKRQVSQYSRRLSPLPAALRTDCVSRSPRAVSARYCSPRGQSPESASPETSLWGTTFPLQPEAR